MSIMNNRGMSHIEAILAFILFISAIMAILYLFNFPEDKSNIDSNLNDLAYSIKNNVSSEMTLYGIKINSNINNLTLNISNNITGKKVYVLDYNQNELNASIVDPNQGIICLKSQNNSINLNNFVYLYISDDLRENLANGGCSGSSEQDYNLTSNQKYDYASESKVNILKNMYMTNYPELKSYLKMPLGEEIGFSFEINETNKIIAQKDVPNGVEIFAKDYNVNFLDNQTNKILIGNLKIKIW